MFTNNKKIVKLNGGLGNQMFQYAFACALANKFNADIVFDLSYFEDVKQNNNVTSRVLELDAFNLDIKEVSRDDLAKIIRPNFKFKLKRSLAKAFPKIFNINYIGNKHIFNFEKKFFDSPDYLFYDGYFQNEQYFKHIRNIVLNKFSLKENLNEENQAILNEITKTNSVSIHVRRGDYVAVEYINKLHGICSLDYYKSAINYISKHVEQPHFFLFSDDISWVSENLKIEYPYTIVNLNQDKGVFDLELMKHCKHNIIANSSFSWWGAWLNENAEKIVIAPENWINMKEKCDIIPKEWIKL